MDKDCLIRNKIQVGHIFKYEDNSLWKIKNINVNKTVFLTCFEKGINCWVGQDTNQPMKTLLMHKSWTKVNG